MSAEAHAHAEEHGHAEAAHGDAHADAAHGDAHAAHGHPATTNTPAAANDNVEHGAHAPQAAHGHPALAHGHTAANDNQEHHDTPHTPHGGQSPIIRFRDWIFGTSEKVVDTTAEIGKSINHTIRAGDIPPVEEKSFLSTPAYAAGHFIDGTILNSARRAMEGISPITSFVKSAIGVTLGTILKPSNLDNGTTERHAKQILKDVGMLTKNVIMSPFRTVDEFADRAVDRTIKQISYQVERVPLIGKLISSPIKWISGKIKNAVSMVTNLADTLTSPLGGSSANHAHDAGHAHADSHNGSHGAHAGAHH